MRDRQRDPAQGLPIIFSPQHLCLMIRRWCILLLLITNASGYGGAPHRRDDGSSSRTGRRSALSRLIIDTVSMPIVTSALLHPSHCFASDDVIVATEPPLPSLLESRYQQQDNYPPPTYGMEFPDIYYPPSFLGTWRAVSKTIDVQAPCGYDLFTGGKEAYDVIYATEVEGGKGLEYSARFISSTLAGGSEEIVIVADREYNSREIAKAAMGTFSVVDTPIATPNRYTCLLAPPGNDTGDLISVDILAIGRRAEPKSPLRQNKFVCAEYVRQIVSRAKQRRGGDNPNSLSLTVAAPLSVKEIETISIYSADNDKMDRITCQQRTATYLVPSQTDPIAFKKWQLSGGRPVDVRRYDVIYTRI